MDNGMLQIIQASETDWTYKKKIEIREQQQYISHLGRFAATIFPSFSLKEMLRL
jgi:hypothetical protein